PAGALVGAPLLGVDEILHDAQCLDLVGQHTPARLEEVPPPWVRLVRASVEAGGGTAGRRGPAPPGGGGGGPGGAGGAPPRGAGRRARGGREVSGPGAEGAAIPVARWSADRRDHCAGRIRAGRHDRG